MSETYYAPTKKAQPITLSQLQQRLTTVGLPCTVEEDSLGMHWLVFEPHESTLCVSTTEGHVSLATFHFGLDDDTNVGDTVERIMYEIGFSADEGADYA